MLTKLNATTVREEITETRVIDYDIEHLKMQKKMVEDMIASSQKELADINAKIGKCAEGGIEIKK